MQQRSSAGFKPRKVTITPLGLQDIVLYTYCISSNTVHQIKFTNRMCYLIIVNQFKIFFFAAKSFWITKFYIRTSISDNI